VKEKGLPSYGWKVFETSGTAAGQKNAFALLSFTGKLAVVGFTMDKVDIRLSNVMAFDADVFGNWACRPEYYPDVVTAVLKEEINVRDNIEEHPLDSINDIIGLALKHKLERRAILVP
jgi:6-hydroxycyclohex-1-ene-1-carbonyl-CoA dehydrogenase